MDVSDVIRKIVQTIARKTDDISRSFVVAVTAQVLTDSFRTALKMDLKRPEIQQFSNLNATFHKYAFNKVFLNN